MTKPNSRSLSFRVAEETANQLDALADSTERPRSWLLEQALEQYLERQNWQVAHIQHGLRELDAGASVDHAKVADWLQSWGTDSETEPPK